MLKLNKILYVIVELVKNSGSTPPKSGRGCISMHDRLTTQCEKQNDSDLRECDQANSLHNISMSTILDIAKCLVKLSELSVPSQTQEYEPATSEYLHTYSSC